MSFIRVAPGDMNEVALFTLLSQMEWAIASGFRNSGLSIGKSHKIMLVRRLNDKHPIEQVSCAHLSLCLLLAIAQAVRSTHTLEAPVAHNSQVIVSEEVIG